MGLGEGWPDERILSNQSNRPQFVSSPILTEPPVTPKRRLELRGNVVMISKKISNEKEELNQSTFPDASRIEFQIYLFYLWGSRKIKFQSPFP